MTTTTTATDSAIELGHPVRSFVVVLISLAVALLAVQASGAVFPRITNFEGRSWGHAVNDQAQWTAVAIRNDGLLAVRVESVRWPTASTAEPFLEVLPDEVDVPSGPTSAAPSAVVDPFTLDAGERRVVVLHGLTTCPEYDTGPLRLEVRTAVGLTRTVTVDGTESRGAAPCP